MMKLSTQETEKVFAMYLGGTCIIHGEATSYPETLTAEHINRYGYRTDWYQLSLTPLDKITDEHANELSMVVYPKHSTYDYLYGAPTGKFIANLIRQGRPYSRLHPEARMIYAHQYLISKGYAVPLWFGIDHQANGKTAIELNIAIPDK